LTTYTFSAGALDTSGNYDATHEERLPPGAFSLRQGFPHWFESGRRSRNASYGSETSFQRESPSDQGSGAARPANIVQVLEYVKSAFEDASLLDNLPLDSAGNQGAWHAWRAYRGLPNTASRPASPVKTHFGNVPKHPGEWKWDGVWESRVKHGIESSMSDAALFGSSNVRGVSQATETVRETTIGVGNMLTVAKIRFVRMDEEALESACSEMLGLPRTVDI